MPCSSEPDVTERNLAVQLKDSAIAVIHQLPDDITLPAMLRELAERLAAPPDEDWDADELTQEQWALFVAQGLQPGLSDPRDDTYTLQDGVSFANAR